MRVADGLCIITPGGDEPADLVITQSVEQVVNALLPLAVLKRGEGEASDQAMLAHFAHFFPPPAPDQVLTPLP